MFTLPLFVGWLFFGLGIVDPAQCTFGSVDRGGFSFVVYHCTNTAPIPLRGRSR